MYTVEELIEALKQCPKDYQITIHALDMDFDIDAVGINDDAKTVDLFTE